MRVAPAALVLLLALPGATALALDDAPCKANCVEVAPAERATLTCVNRGVVAQVTLLGENRYCVGEACTNRGLVLLVGRSRSCHGDGVVVACATDHCLILPSDVRAGGSLP